MSYYRATGNAQLTAQINALAQPTVTSSGVSWIGQGTKDKITNVASTAASYGKDVIGIIRGTFGQPTATAPRTLPAGVAQPFYGAGGGSSYTPAPKSNTMLYVGIGAAALVGAVLLMRKR